VEKVSAVISQESTKACLDQQLNREITLLPSLAFGLAAVAVAFPFPFAATVFFGGASHSGSLSLSTIWKSSPSSDEDMMRGYPSTGYDRVFVYDVSDWRRDDNDSRSTELKLPNE
jgi:hypothetical protein